jgi:hypothetical protein
MVLKYGMFCTVYTVQYKKGEGIGILLTVGGQGDFFLIIIKSSIFMYRKICVYGRDSP